MQTYQPMLQKIIKEHFDQENIPEKLQGFLEAIEDEFEKYESLQSDQNGTKGLLTELEAVNEELRNFAYIVSHDLKAPLRGIKSITKWLSLDYKDKFDESGIEMLHLLESRTMRLQQLIDGVLAYSKVSNKAEDITCIDSHQLALEVIDLLSAPSHIEIEVVKQLPTLFFEETKLRQVFQNLLSNAIKYMDKSQGLIRVGCEDRGDMWEFYVSDNGPGIEKTYHDKIFQIFQTLQSRDKTESAGVGLSIVKKVLDKFGGSIWVESIPTQGCVFYFSIPKELNKTHPNQAYQKWLQNTESTKNEYDI